MQLSIFTVVLLAGIGIIGMIVIAPDPINSTYYAGLILVFIYGYTFFKLRFIWATMAGWTIVILYEIVGILLIDMPIEIFINNNFFFLCGNLIGMIAGYSIEYYSRRDFIQNILLEEEKKKVNEARRSLEKKVEERTLQVVTTNEKLIDKIREQKRTEKEYRTLFEKTSDVVFISAADGKFIDINQAGIELFGYSSKDEILRCNIGEDLYVNPTDRLEFKRIIERDDQIKDFEIKLKNKEGKEIIALETTTAFRDEDGKIIAYHGIIRDITKKRKFEQHLFQTQKMESIGMLAGGIAHDFNNILTALKGYADIALMKIKPDSPDKKQIIGISRGIERAENLTRQLLAFSRKQIIESRVININDLILNLEKMLIRLIGEDINLDTILTNAIENIKADPGQIEQVLVNLVINARDAITQKNSQTKDKKITIETKSVYIDFSYATNHPEFKVGNYLLIAVSDTGVGMSSDVLSKIYEPFYTTKEHGKGTGLGLSTVYGIIKQNQGHVYAYSEINKGSTFKIYWPTTDQDIEPEYSTELENELIKGHETILFVEDDYDVRNTICDALKSLNYKIIEASNGVEAINIVKQNNIKLDMLITDVVMPEMDGKELAKEIINYFPGIKILFTSGYTDNHIVRSGQLEKGINFLHKPFSIKDISKKIRIIIEN